MSVSVRPRVREVTTREASPCPRQLVRVVLHLSRSREAINGMEHLVLVLPSPLPLLVPSRTRIKRNSEKLYAIGKTTAEADDNVVAGTFLVHNSPTFVLFDSGASHSFVSKCHVSKLNLESFIECGGDVVIPSREYVVCTRLFPQVSLIIKGVNLLVDLVEFML